MSDVMVYIPGKGNVNLKAHRVEQAVHEYDERLSFQFNPVQRQWCIYMQMPRGHEPPEIPVYGFNPPEQIPEPHEAVAQLHKMDTVRRGEEIWALIERNSREFRKKKEAAAKEGTDALAEVVEFHNRQAGKTKYGSVNMAIPKNKIKGKKK